MSSIGVVYPEALRRAYGLVSYVETGCFLGYSLGLAAAAGFGRLVSCDICERFVLKCRKRFPEAELFHCDSVPELGEEPAFFWLDAHFPATFGLADEPGLRYPVPEELRLIRQLRPNWQRDVIAVDDLRVIRDRRNPRWRPGELQGRHAACYQDASLADLCAPFEATHEVALMQAAEGVILMLPRAA